ncbi:hypothetical protein [Stutzerimonas stutzeri]|uniref:hypothetical protein n=1 Tax=Stutzerimonas stutzeri TaxID=316 RepID=UPI00210D65F0|nr:hypothetical protein [Stutzerimonas stutzeri]MCQ4243384.1 hypothetical protein [Stutzerimonas stutzeri]
MRKLIVRIGILVFFTFSGSAVYGENISEKASVQIHDGMDLYRVIQDAVNAGISEDEKSSEILELKFQLQADKIAKLEREVEWLKGKPESNTASTVLAAASVIITALGVLIAILSILGYSNIKKEAVKTSRDTAKETVNSIAGVELMDATEKNIIVLMENGRFDEIIQNAVASITYRGIDDIASEGEVK